MITLSIGKHINSHKNYYSFALSITIGSLVANMGFNTKLRFLDMFLSFLTLVGLFILFQVLTSKSRRLRTWLSGRPTILIEKGKLLDENMKKIRFSLDDLNQRLREQGVFDIFEIESAFLEASGELSILKKSEYHPTTKKDLHIPSEGRYLPIELIMDGKIIKKNLTGTYNMNWIESECTKRKLKIEDVYYAVINSNGTLFIDAYHDDLPSPDIE